jgi:hypothetical protein
MAWMKVITDPLGIAGFALALVFSLIGRNHGKNSQWIAPAAYALAAVCVLGGFALAYQRQRVPSPPLIVDPPQKIECWSMQYQTKGGTWRSTLEVPHHGSRKIAAVLKSTTNGKLGMNGRVVHEDGKIIVNYDRPDSPSDHCVAVYTVQGDSGAGVTYCDSNSELTYPSTLEKLASCSQ